MLLVIHASTGAFVGQLSETAFLAFLISFILHFLMDFIPHGDHHVLVENHRAGIGVKKIYAFIMSDVIATSIFLFALAFSEVQFNRELVFWGVVGGILPDMLVAFYELTRIKLLKKFHEIHFKIHNFFPEQKKLDIAFIPGLVIQMALIFFLFKSIF